MVIQNEKKIKGFLCFFAQIIAFGICYKKMAVCHDSRQPNNQRFSRSVATAAATIAGRTVVIVATVGATGTVVAEECNQNDGDDDQPKGGIIE